MNQNLLNFENLDSTFAELLTGNDFEEANICDSDSFGSIFYTFIIRGLLMSINNKTIEEMIEQPKKHLDDIVSNIDDVVNYILFEKGHIDEELYLTELYQVFSIRNVESHFTQWKTLKAHLYMVEAIAEPERYQAIEFLLEKELKMLIASLESILDHEKCVFRCDKSCLHGHFMDTQYCQKKEA